MCERVIRMGQGDGVEALELPVDGPFDEARADLHPLIVFHRDAPGPPLVLVRSWSRESRYHQALAKQLGPEQPVISLGPPAYEDVSRYPVVMDGWVDHYLETYERLGLGQLAALGGWSFGGSIALELAHRLAGRGFDVTRVLMLDSRMPMGDVRRKPGTLAGTYRKLMIRPRRLKRWVKERVRFAIGRPDHADANEVIPDEVLPPGQLLYRSPSGYTISYLSRSVQSAFVRYVPHVFELRVDLLWTPFSLGYTPGDDSLGWGKWMRGPFELRALSCGHWSMFAEPYVTVLGEHVREVLNSTESPAER